MKTNTEDVAASARSHTSTLKQGVASCDLRSWCNCMTGSCTQLAWQCWKRVTGKFAKRGPKAPTLVSASLASWRLGSESENRLRGFRLRQFRLRTGAKASSMKTRTSPAGAQREAVFGKLASGACKSCYGAWWCRRRRWRAFFGLVAQEAQPATPSLETSSPRPAGRFGAGADA